MASVDDNGFHIDTEIFSILLLACLILAILISGCEKKSDKTNIPQNKQPAVFQNELLDVAFETASSIPLNPHIKDRSRAQEMVIKTCLKLDQPERAMGLIDKIENWRRGLCYADMAYYYAQRGDFNEIQRYINLANRIAEYGSIEDWRSDRIKVRIAQTNSLLRQTKETDNYSLDEQIKILDELVASGIFDTVKDAIESATELFNRFYEDTEKRSLVEQKIKSSWGILPVFIRIDLLTELAGFAVDHSDKSKALELIDEAQLLFDNHQWPVENRVARAAQLAKLRFRAGDVEKARTDANVALALFNDQRENIVNIYRAGAIRPLAEAYQSMGNTKAALSVYKQAIEEGTANPNSRPRAEDLSATCCSMALYAVEPDVELWMRIHQISEALGEPW